VVRETKQRKHARDPWPLMHSEIRSGHARPEQGVSAHSVDPETSPD
jgi:hypothetical protein